MLFNQVIGQEDLKNRLRNFIRDGRIPHATLLHGAPGSGTLALAIAFAQYASCPNRTEEDACGTCSTCQKFSSYQFADLYFSFPFFNISGKEITISDDWFTDWRSQLLETAYFDLDTWRARLTAENKQLQVSVHEALNIIKKLSLKSYEGGYKFMVIWMPEFMRTDTANKLLKIVEEPPDNTLFIFVSQSLENILPTMLSRVQVLRVPALKEQTIAEALVARGMDAKHASDISHFAAGDWNHAVRLSENHDPTALFATEFQSWMRLCFKRDVGALVKWSERMHSLEREGQKHFLRYALEQVRQNMLLNCVGEELTRLNDMEMDFSMKFARFINDSNVLELNEELTRAHEDISRNAFSKMVFLDLSMKTHRLLQSQET